MKIVYILDGHIIRLMLSDECQICGKRLIVRCTNQLCLKILCILDFLLFFYNLFLFDGLIANDICISCCAEIVIVVVLLVSTENLERKIIARVLSHCIIGPLIICHVLHAINGKVKTAGLFFCNDINGDIISDIYSIRHIDIFHSFD